MVELIDHGSDETSILRVAIEGCGHGTLDSIYASIQLACEIKGWDAVDLVIIGGDFQAVRDRFDLNVTAMPAKYREMHDFHKYYWGAKFAPYLTIFIGGNHEASNHLFELYYGGWVAPNIYYLGAASVIQVGPLKIAGMSGIWKGYDYRKPHYERLPYNDDDIYSIYHVRELDVRKLLAYRSQVDIALSHDWPQGIEWLGNHEQLFRYKRHLKEDAVSGKLGSVAAKQVLEHLRPQHWFSAHLHCRYAAVKTFEKATHMSDGGWATAPVHQQPIQQVNSHPAGNHLESSRMTDPSLSAWQNFHTVAQDNEARETAEHLRDQKTRRENSERSGIPLTATYTFDVTHKKLKLDSGLAQPIVPDQKSDSDESIDNGVSLPQNAPQNAPQIDGCCESSQTKTSQIPQHQHEPEPERGHDGLHIGSSPIAGVVATPSLANPDAIDLDFSDDDDDVISSPGENARPIHSGETVPLLHQKGNSETSIKSGNDEGETISVGRVTSHPATATTSTADGRSIHSAKASLQSLVELNPNRPPVPSVAPPPQTSSINKTSASSKEPQDQSAEGGIETDVSEEMRAKLAALSSKFSEPEKVEISPTLPHPEAISNNTTRFLALSKCGPGQNFLHLQEITSLLPSTHPVGSSVKIRYDSEWLAILRVFASELTLGGKPSDFVPKHRGDTYYRQRIIEEEQWIQKNVVDRDLLDIPYNFEVMPTTNDIASATGAADMPREMTNPQTAAFCDLIGIENKFDISEEERDARRRAGPAPAKEKHSSRGGFGGRGGRGGRGGGGGGFHHGRGRGGGGRGGRGGRGRGRGHY